MFRRKKYGGGVTELDGDIPTDGRDELGLEEHRERQARRAEEEDLGAMSVQQLERLALDEATQGKDSTARALRTAVEARDVGVATADTMAKQTQQLEKMSEDIEVVHDYLDKSDRTLDKMTKPKLVRLFARKKKGASGLKHARASRKELESREELRQTGVEGIDLKEMGGDPRDVVHMADLERDKLLGGVTGSETKAGGKFRIGKKEETRVDPRHLNEDYSQYSEGVASVMREQDKDLDHIADVVGDMKALANAMNNELSYQGELIEEVQGFTAETSRRTKENARRIKKIK